MKRFVHISLSLLLLACQGDPAETAAKKEASSQEAQDSVELAMHPDWSLHSSMYEVNIRQHTPEGTINAMRAKLPDLQKLGVKILWVMPVQPLGIENRQGSVGDYYAIRDYQSVSPEFGTMQDFKDFVVAAHDLGFKVILDWPAAATAPDAKWKQSHPQWYSGAAMTSAEQSQLAALDYKNEELQAAMLKAMQFWVKETDIDGFRCAMAGQVPLTFWRRARKSLNRIKPVFMAADAGNAAFHKEAFDLTTDHEFNEVLHSVVKGEKNVTALDNHIIGIDQNFPRHAYRLYYLTDHRENSLRGTVHERLGNNSRNAFILSATLPYGMPLVYSGQEYGLNKRLAYFDKDTINGNDTALFKWYASVIDLKMNHPALMMGPKQGAFNRYTNSESPSFYAFSRTKGKERLLILLNFGEKEELFDLQKHRLDTKISPALTGEKIQQTKKGRIVVPPQGYVLAKLKV